MPTDTAARVDATRGMEEAFLDLVCADEQLLRAEFDAIIAEEWPTTPPPADPRAAEPEGGSQRRKRLPLGCAPAPTGRTRHPRVRRSRRQRSPPVGSWPSLRERGMSTEGR